jgi:ABC-2 type transport system permease protein
VSRKLAIVRHEFLMSIRRPGLWIGYTLLCLFYIVTSIMPAAGNLSAADIITPDRIWPEAGLNVFMFNIFFPLLAGVLSADRLQRDFRGGVRELQRSSPLSIPTYVLAKYLGVLLSVLLPVFLLVMINGALLVARGIAPIGILLPMLAAFLVIALPSHAFVVAFSLACPLVIPLRVYQVLFTGYWFWGNLLSPRAFPTISDTVLNAVGQIPLQAFFGMYKGSTHPLDTGFTPLQAVINLIVLAACIAGALFVTERYLHLRESRA